MYLHKAKILYFCLSVILFTANCDAIIARFESDVTKGELYLIFQWDSKDDVIVLNPSFVEGHPLYKKSSFNTVQQQDGLSTEQTRSYVLEEQWTNIPKAVVKVLQSGKTQEVSIDSITIKRKFNAVNWGSKLLFVVCCLILPLAWLIKRFKLPPSKTEPVFSKESAVQAAETSNWSLLFEILASNVPWRSELNELPLEQMQQQWQFASREPSDKDRQRIIKLLHRSNHAELHEAVINTEEKILSEVLEK